MQANFSKIIIVSSLILGLTGCAPFTQYRTDYSLCKSSTSNPSPECEKHSLQQIPTEAESNYQLGFIEFDDQGQLWDRKQMNAVLTQLESEAASEDIVMVVFVHGWKHSAAPGDNNINTFRHVLAQLSEQEVYNSKITKKPPRQIAGIYLGWRGGSITTPVVENLTFWDRKNTAQLVGQRGVTEVLSRIEMIKRDKDSTLPGGSRTRLAVVGHSFGGAVVYNALEQILASRLVHGSCKDGLQCDVVGFGNLVVLINPAFEALQFTPLSDMTTERGYYFESQLPAMVVLTSEADYATRYAFPAGRFFSTIFENDRREPKLWRKNATSKVEETVDESQANKSAIGHFELYRTHSLYPVGDKTRIQIKELSVEESARLFTQLKEDWGHDHPASKIPFEGITLERTANSAGRNPYLSVYVDKELIKDHNDIDDPRIIEFIKQMILITSENPDHPDK